MTTLADLTHFRYSVDDAGVATVLVDTPEERMNTLAPKMLGDLASIVEAIESDPAVVAVVLGSAKPDNFIAGADIRWLRTLDDSDAIVAEFTQAKEMFLRLENVWMRHGKPVIAAIHGPCLGGGMEVAMTASARICTDSPKTQFGQPEIKLGLIPAGGGTQRMPRLVGIAASLDLILTGRSVRPKKALALGLVDEVVAEKDLLDTARKRALEAASGASPATADSAGSLWDRMKGMFTPARLQKLALETNAAGRRLLFDRAEKAMLAETKGNYPAAPAAFRAIKAGVEQGVDVGYDVEIAEFAKIAQTSEAEALMSIFFSSQDLKKDSGIETDAEPKDVERVAILGGGLMGGGIAAVNTTKAGVTSRIKEVDDAGVRRGLEYVSKVVGKLVKRRRLDKSAADAALTQVTATTSWRGFEESDVVIEAVFEDLALKQQMLIEIEGIGRDDVIFASNTSSIPITEIAKAAKRPEHVIGMHYFSPVEKMPLLEIVTTEQTADWVTATCVNLGKRQGKTVIVVNDGAGFYTTRILAPYAGEVFHLLDEGARIEDIDKAMVQWGFPVGPVTLADEVGIDVQAKIGKVMHEAFGDRMAQPSAIDALVADDRKGRKNGRGFYEYEDGERKGVDGSVYQVLGVTGQRTVPMTEIQERIALQLINEAALCLEEGILRSARDGDMGAVFGLGFPPFRGGPFKWIDTVGAKEIVARMEALAEEHGPRFQPAAILQDHAATGELFRR